MTICVLAIAYSVLMVASSAYLGFPSLGLKDSGSFGRTHPHVVSGGIKCEKGLKECSSLSRA
jgi:hypothetical protein